MAVAGVVLLAGVAVACATASVTATLRPAGDGYAYGLSPAWTYVDSEGARIEVQVTASTSTRVWVEAATPPDPFVTQYYDWTPVYDHGSPGFVGLEYPQAAPNGLFALRLRADATTGPVSVSFTVRTVDRESGALKGSLEAGTIAGSDCNPAVIQPGADLAGTDLSGRHLEYCDLSDTNLTGANLQGAFLGGSLLFNANLTGADLRHVSMQYAFGINTATGLVSAALGGADLRNTGIDLSHQNLTGAALDGTYLSGANLTGANLTNASLVYADLSATTGLNTVIGLLSANIQGTNFSDAGLDLTGADLSGRNLTNTYFVRDNVTNMNVTGANLRGANFGDTTGLDTVIGLATANLPYAIFGAGFDLDGADLHGHDLTHLQLYIGSHMRGADLRGAQLDYSGMHGTDLQGANLSGASLLNASDTDLDVRDANLTSVTGLTGLYLRGASDLHNVNLSNVVFSAGDDLHQLALVGANLTNTSLRAANLTNADLTNTNLAGADLRSANLQGATTTGHTGWPVFGDTICPDGTNSNANGGTCITHGF